MMKDFENREEKIIDEFYGESVDKKLSYQYSEFGEKLERVSERLDVLNEDIFNFEIDTMGIIKMADDIKEGKRAKKELGLFIGTAIAVLGLYGFVGLTFGYKFLIISQGILMTLMPWIIVPIAIKRRGGSEA
jgi:hypothetical protein